MSTSYWNPESGQAKQTPVLTETLLERYIGISKDDQLEQISALLTTSEQQDQSSLMKIGQQQWSSAVDNRSDEEIQHLMRFLTVAEKLPGWEAGPESPVIWLGKVLKQRGSGIPRELVVWIKAHSDNRFLPNGPLL